jgi:hypothetical protein
MANVRHRTLSISPNRFLGFDSCRGQTEGSVHYDIGMEITVERVEVAPVSCG